MKTVVVINGYPMAGKDTITDMTQKHLGRRGIIVDSVSSIDGVRRMLRLAGIKVHKKTPELRALMATVGDAVELYGDLKTVWTIRDCCASTAEVTFVHMREPAMIEKLRLAVRHDHPHWHFRTLFVRGRGLTDHSNANDAGVEGCEYDFTIDNSGSLSELGLKVEALAAWLGFPQKQAAIA